MWQRVKRNRFWLFLLTLTVAVVGAAFLFSQGTPSDGSLQVNLGQRVDLPPLRQMSSISYGREEDVLRIAIAGVTSPIRTLDRHQELLHYMGAELGKEVRLILKPSYAEINDMVRGGRVDVAFICPLAYSEGHRDFGMELLVAPQVNGRTVYYSYLIVPEDSAANRLEDLKERSFAFADPLSNSGYLVPSYQLLLLGEKPASFFSRYTFTYSHDNSITAVASRLVDGAAVDSLVYDSLVTTDKTLAAKTKIIARWGPYGIPPLVVNPNLDPDLKQRLRDFFLNLDNSPRGSEILQGLGFDKFVIISNDAYDGIGEMREQLER